MNTGVTLLSFNIANYDDHQDWVQRKAIFEKIILQYTPQLIAFQEIRFDAQEPTTKATYQDMAEQILSDLIQKSPLFQNYQIVTSRAQYYNPGSFSPSSQMTTLWEGLSVLSAFPIVQAGYLQHTRPTGSTDFNNRITQWVTLRLPSSDPSLQGFTLFNTHFSYDTVNLSSNVAEVLLLLNSFSSQPKLLVGDFNATPDDQNVSKLAKAGYSDVWPLLHEGSSGFSYPSDKPQSRIDYCWADQKMKPNMKAMGLVGNNPVDGIYPSDHLGLVIQFQI
eukprot:TRINITY_DN8848_c0_g1_i1.p1 TRINITY_DN8848_c0_g1~~TRINITY_DN8848_c0_g1_i1.p1  ORF type:complete len:277 (-),score=61.29 TRINITY_DN8848_c0_g1_i1:177-1007(-)